MTTTPENNLLMHICRLGKLWVSDWEHPSNQAVAYESLSAYAANPDEPIVDWVTRELEDFSVIAMQAAVKDFYLQYGTEEEKLAYGIDERPYSRCIYCHKLIRWDKELGALTDPAQPVEPTLCTPPTREAGIAYAEHGHTAKWLTLGEFRGRTAHLPDTFPITADAQGPDAGQARGGDWYNLRLTEVPTLEELERDQPASLLLDIADDFDTRQW